MYYVGGVPFINGALGNPTLVSDYSFNFWTLAMGLTSVTALQWLIGIGWIAWDLAILGFGVIFFARYLFAQSFDRIFPSSFAYVSPKYSSPVVAHLIDLVVTAILIGAAAFLYGTFSALYGIIVASLIYFAFIGVTAIVYAMRHEKGTSKGVLATAGVLSALVFTYITYQFLASPTIWGGTDLAYGYIVATFLFGLVAYFVSRSYHLKQGVDISLAFKEIPPD
jgi:amino acid transporter